MLDDLPLPPTEGIVAINGLQDGEWVGGHGQSHLEMTSFEYLRPLIDLKLASMRQHQNRYWAASRDRVKTYR
jgi:hypothetical protein